MVHGGQFVDGIAVGHVTLGGCTVGQVVGHSVGGAAVGHVMGHSVGGGHVTGHSVGGAVLGQVDGHSVGVTRIGKLIENTN